MSDPSDPRLMVLHALRLKGFAGADDVAGLTGLDTATVESLLEELRGDALVLYREGRLTGWALTPAGRAEQEARLQAELTGCGARDQVFDAYKRFLDLNNDLL